MYHIFEEIPAAKAAIQDSFVKLYNKMDYDRMNIKLLCGEAHVARTTFYFHYDNLGSVKEDIENILLKGLLEIAENSANGDYATMDFQQFVEKTTEFIDDNREYFYAFLVAQPDYAFLNQWKQEIKEHFRLEYPQLQKIKHYDFYSDVIASAILNSYSYWMLHPEDVDFRKSEEILRLIVKTL